MIIVLANDKKYMSSAEFWDSSSFHKATRMRELLSFRDYFGIYELATQGRVIENNSTQKLSGEITKSFGDLFFDKFIVLLGEVGIEDTEIIPLLLNCISSSSDVIAWKSCASEYLKYICKYEYDTIVDYVVEYPNADLWRLLVSCYPEHTTDIMLELLLEKPGKDKTVLRLVLSETKLNIVPILDDEYFSAGIPVRTGIVRLLLLFKNNAEAVRLLTKIRQTEKSLTVLRVFSGDIGRPVFKEICTEGNGVFTVVLDDENCVFTLNDGDLNIVSQSANGFSVAKRAVKSRYEYLQNSYYTGDGLEISALVDAANGDALFSKLCEKYLFAVYNVQGYPSKLFLFDNKKIKGINCDIDVESDDYVAVVHPSELADSKLQYPVNEFEYQMKKDCFLPSKEEKRLSAVPAFAGAIINLQVALKRAAACGLKIGISGDHNYFYFQRGGYYCVNTFTVQKNTISLGNAAFYDYDKLPISGKKILLQNALPVVLEHVSVRIFSEFLSGIYFVVRGKIETGE